MEEVWVKVDSRPPARLEADPYTLFDVLRGLVDRGREVSTRSRDDEQPEFDDDIPF